MRKLDHPPRRAGRRSDTGPCHCAAFGSGWPALLLALVASFAAAAVVADTIEEPEAADPGAAYVFRYRMPPQPAVAGTATHATDHPADHGHGGLSESEFKQAQADVETFWREFEASGRPLDQSTVLELYRRAKHFSVVHALLGNTIGDSHNTQIGQLRAVIHQQVLSNLVDAGVFGPKMGVNDFGTVGNAKSDIDFTPYAEGEEGRRLVEAYEAEFKRLTGGLHPGQLDIVAHKYEAIIPDWRASSSIGDFEQRIRGGMQLLKANPEAYFLEGAYHQQVMGRSAQGTTLTWIEKVAGKIVRTPRNAAVDARFMYFRPDVRARYAWGGAIGNWHFYHAHPGDKVAQAKYLLRSLDDGARLSQLSDGEAKAFKSFENLTDGERSRVIDSLYGGKVDPEVKAYFLEVMRTAATIREIKSAGGNTAGPEAYKPLIELERTKAPHLDDAALFERAKASMDRYGAAMLLQNNVLSAQARLTDWLAPNLKKGTRLPTFDNEGRPTLIDIDDAAIKRLQYSAFFELEAGLEMLPKSEIDAIKRANPRYAADIDIMQGVIEKKRQMMFAPEHLDSEAAHEYRRSVAEDVLSDIARLQKVAENGGTARFLADLGGTAWQRGQQFEDSLQRMLVDGMGLIATGGNRNTLDLLHQMRESTEITNARLINPRWLARMDKGNSVLEVLKVWAKEGELNQAVLERAFYEGMSFVPGVGTLYQLQGGTTGVVTMISTKLIPGYGPLLLTLQIGKNSVELTGLVIFEPLRDDRIVMAYQGYLDPEAGGIFASGQTERVDKVTSILKMVDPAGTLPLDERRRRLYHYFHDNITATIDKDPNFAFTEEEWPLEWIEEEQKWLELRVRQHVLDWWNIRGYFAEDDDIAGFTSKMLGVSEEEFRRKLEIRLWKDYWAGRQVAHQQKVVEREESQGYLESLWAQILAVPARLQQIAAECCVPDFMRSAQMLFADTLSQMPEVEPAIEILMAPRVETLELEGYDEEELEGVSAVNFRAKVYASSVAHPQPWKVTWSVDHGGDSSSFENPDGGFASLENSVGEGVGTWPVSVTAVATDAEGTEIVSRTVQLEIEKIKLGTDPEEEDEETGDEDDGDPGDLPDDATDPTGDDGAGARAAGAASVAALTEAQADCDSATGLAEEAAGRIGGVSGGLAGVGGTLESLRDRADSLAELASQARAAAGRANAAADELARLRDRAAALRDEACSKAEAIGGATSMDARNRLLSDVQSAQTALAAMPATASTLIETLRAAGEELRRADGEARSVVAALAAAEAELAALGTPLAEARAAFDQATAAVEASRSRVDQVAAEAAVARGQLAEAAASAAAAAAAAPAEATAPPPEAAATAEIEAQRAQLDTLEQASAECQASAEAALLSTGETLAELEAKADELDALVVEIRQGLEAGGYVATIAGAMSEADTALTFSEPFFESILNRADDAALCAEIAEGNMLNPLPANDPGDGDTGGTGTGGGWTTSGDVETVGGGGTEGEPEPAAPVSDPIIDGLISQAVEAFGRCDFTAAKTFADRIAARDPDHPWLAANLPKILDNERRQRAALAALRRAEAALASPGVGFEQIAAARAAAQEAARVAPFCLVDDVTALVSAIDRHVDSIRASEEARRDREREANRTSFVSGLGTLITAIGAVASAVEGEAYVPPPNLPTGGTGGGPGGGGADPCTYKWSYSNVYASEPTCDCPGYTYRGVCVPSGGGGGGGGGGGDGATPVTGPVEDKVEGETRVSSRNVKVCVTDVNSVLDDQYALYVNGAFAGAIAHPEGGATCYNSVLRSGPNRLELRLTATRGKGTYLLFTINDGEFSANFGGSTNHIWSVIAP